MSKHAVVILDEDGPCIFCEQNEHPRCKCGRGTCPEQWEGEECEHCFTERCKTMRICVWCEGRIDPEKWEHPLRDCDERYHPPKDTGRYCSFKCEDGSRYDH